MMPKSAISPLGLLNLTTHVYIIAWLIHLYRFHNILYRDIRISVALSAVTVAAELIKPVLNLSVNLLATLDAHLIHEHISSKALRRLIRELPVFFVL